MPISTLFVAGPLLGLRVARGDRSASALRPRRTRRVRNARMEAESNTETDSRFVPPPPIPSTPMDPALGAETAVVSVSPTASTEVVTSTHDQWLNGLLAAAPPPLDPDHPFAKAAMTAAVTQAPPSRRVEEWRFTDLRSVFAARFVASVGDPAAAAKLGASIYVEDGATAALVFVDGEFCPESSVYDEAACAALKEAGGYVGGLEGYKGDKNAVVEMFARDELSGAKSIKGANGLFAALNTKLARDAAIVCVPADYAISKPVVVLFAGSGGAVPERTRASAPRLAVIAGRGAAVDVLESHVTLVPDTCPHSLAFGCTAVVAEESSRVRHYFMNGVSRDAALVASSHAEVRKSASYEMFSVIVGGKMGRHSVGIDLVGEEAHAALKGAAVANGFRVSDLHSRIVHNAERTTSEQLQKNIASDRGRTVFSGKIIVTPNGDQTDSSQLCRSLLLSEKAQVDAMPVLEIATDDVKCTHGATVADLQPDELFYCQSRGLNTLLSRRLLITGFVKDVLRGCPIPQLSKIVEPIIDEVSNEMQDAKQGSGERTLQYLSI